MPPFCPPWTSGRQMAIDKPSDVPLLHWAWALWGEPRPGPPDLACHTLATVTLWDTQLPRAFLDLSGITPAFSVCERENNKGAKGLWETLWSMRWSWFPLPITQAGFKLVLKWGRVFPALQGQTMNSTDVWAPNEKGRSRNPLSSVMCVPRHWKKLPLCSNKGVISV